MGLWKLIARGALALRELLGPAYHPERHYMRGPGPACARRPHQTEGDMAPQ